MTTFSGQSCVLGTADNCGLLREEWGALTCVETRIGQEMGSMLAAAVFWRVAAMALSLSDAVRRTGSLNDSSCAAVTVRARCQTQQTIFLSADSIIS